MKKRKQRILFGKEIDEMISLYALGVSFSAIGVFLLLNNNYFPYTLISNALGAVFAFFGLMFISSGLEKNSSIKGTYFLTLGIVLFAVWCYLYLKVNSSLLNCFIFVLLIFGGYGMIYGLFCGIYSVLNNIKSAKNETDEKSATIQAVLLQSLLFLTEVCGLVVAILNVISASAKAD